METKLFGNSCSINEIGNIIIPEKAACLDMNLSELMGILRSQITKFWSWGAHAFTTNFKDVWHDNKIIMRANAMFRFKVSGHHHKGHVYIFLSGLDLFDVYLTTTKGKITKKICGLYNDQLVDWINENVEKIAAYKD